MLAPISDDKGTSKKRAVFAALLQIFVLGAGFSLYREGRMLSAGHISSAFDHAEDLWNIERWFHLPSEQTVQSLAMHSHWFIELANRYYVTMHFPVTIGVLVWLYVRHRDQYRWARNLIIAVTLPALVLQVGLPVAPPRMLHDHGLLDTMALYGPSAYPADSATGLSNQFAALPSLHVGWSVLLAACTWRTGRRSIACLLSLHALMTTTVVLVTGNHYWFDALLGAGLVAIAWPCLGAYQEWKSHRLPARPLVAVRVPTGSILD